MSIADDRRSRPALTPLASAAAAERTPPPPWALLGALQDRLPVIGPAKARAARTAKARRLEALGYELPSLEQRRRNLALTVALREWPR